MHISMIDPSLFTLPYDQGLAEGLTRNGHHVLLYGRRPGPDDARLSGVELVDAFYHVASSKPVSRLPRAPRLAIKGLDHLASMARLPGRLRRQRPDLIHFQWLPLPLVDGRLLGRVRKVAPLILTVHDTNPFNGSPSSKLQARGFLACLDHFERIIVHTEQGYKRLRGFGLPAERMRIVPHGPMTAPAPPSRADPMSGGLTFTLFGKIKPYKGADILIEAFALLPERLRAQARLRIIGKPYMDLEPLQALVRVKGLGDRVSIEPRFVGDEEIAGIFGPGTVAVFPYREIDASGVLFQALGHGRPVVASRLGAFAEMLRDGAQGHLVPPENAQSLADALAHLVEDRVFAARCAAAALDLSSRAVTWEAVARETEQVYMAAIAAGTRARAGASLPAGRSRATEISRSTRKITGGNC